MGIGSVNVVAVDNKGGVPQELERVFLFVVRSANENETDTNVIAVNTASDFTKIGVLAADAEVVSLARMNAKDANWFAKLLIVPPSATLTELLSAVDIAFSFGGLNIEDIVFVQAVESRDQIVEINAAIADIRTKYGVFSNAHVATALKDGETLSADILALKSELEGLVAEYVSTTIAYGSAKKTNLVGVVVGRLCNPAVSIADTPMRVRTGAILGMEMPELGNGVLTMAEVKDLADSRISMPQYYQNYAGIYWTNHCQLNAEGSDYLDYENRRVVDYLSRRIRVKAISKVADRTLNETPTSMERAKTFFAQVLKSAAKSYTLGGEEQPGLIDSATDNDVKITWESKEKVRIDFIARTLACPKTILVSIGLDLSVING